MRWRYRRGEGVTKFIMLPNQTGQGMLTNVEEYFLDCLSGQNLHQDHITSVSQTNMVRVTGTTFTQIFSTLGVTYPDNLFVPPHRGSM